MRKTVAAATMAASLTIGGAAGVALFTPTLSGAQTDETTESTDTAGVERGARLGEVLAPLVQDGTITQAQADAVVEALLEAGPMRGHGFGFRGDVAEAVTEVLGLDADEIRSRLADGQSLADIAEAQGVAAEDLVAAIVAAHQERLDAAVEAGRLSEEEAAERAEDMAERATEMIERTPMLDGEGPHGMGRGMGRHGGGMGVGGGMGFGPGAGTTDS